MNCKTCNTPYEGNFCPSCGEKHFNEKDLTIKHFVEETFEGLVHFDGKFFRTLKLLISRPGQLSLNYVEGRRMRFMKPVQFFLVINLIFFFLLGNGNIYSLPLTNYTTYTPFTNYNTKEIINKKLQKDSLTYGEYSQVFNEKMNANSKEFLLLFILFYGICFTLLFFWKTSQLATHFVFATHFMAFILVYFFVTQYIISIPFRLITHQNYQHWFEVTFSILAVTVFFIYLLFAVKRFYKTSWFWAIISSALVAGTFFTFIQYYRMLLFFKILYF